MEVVINMGDVVYVLISVILGFLSWKYGAKYRDLLNHIQYMRGKIGVIKKVVEEWKEIKSDGKVDIDEIERMVKLLEEIMEVDGIEDNP